MRYWLLQVRYWFGRWICAWRGHKPKELLQFGEWVQLKCQRCGFFWAVTIREWEDREQG